MTNQLIPVFAGEISGASVQLCDARLLHTFLESAQDFTTWIKNRISKYRFVENQDYLLHKIVEQLPSGRKHKIDYHLTIDMAKELGMIERSEKGRQIRRYFLDMERIARGIINPPPAPERKTKKALPGCLTLTQQDHIKELVKARAERVAPEKAASVVIKTWSSIKSKFGVSYKEIPQEEYLNVVSLIERLPIEGELMPKAMPEITTTTDKDYSHAKQHIHNLKAIGRVSVDDTLVNEFEEELTKLEQCLVRAWTEVDEALLRISVATTFLKRWKR